MINGLRYAVLDVADTLSAWSFLVSVEAVVIFSVASAVLFARGRRVAGVDHRNRWDRAVIVRKEALEGLAGSGGSHQRFRPGRLILIPPY